MSSMLLQGLVEVKSAQASLPSQPERVFRRNNQGIGPSYDVELEQLPRPQTAPAVDAKTTAASVSVAAAASAGEPAEPSLLSDIERAGRSTDVDGVQDGVEALQTIWDPYMNRFRFLSSCLLAFGNGMNDAASGALLPYLESHYDIGYAVVSLIFVGSALGFIVIAPFIDSLRERLGRGKLMALAQTLMAASYIALVCRAPFPVLVLAFFFCGMGFALNLAITNVFCGSLANNTAALGGLHGSYGVGGIVAPLAATSIATSPGSVWSRYYIITLSLAVFNAIFASWAFNSYERDEARTSSGSGQESLDQSPLHTTTTERAARGYSGDFSILSSRVVLLGALFIFAYQGAEVSISGWVISFLITSRGGDPNKVGYVTTGFWGGITLGRFLLAGLAHRIGEKRFVYAIVPGAAIFQLLVWFVPNVIGDAVSLAIVGFLLGPVYICAIAVFMRLMSKHEHVSGLGIISAFGTAGGAVAPFTTGLLAQAAGTFVLHPISIGLFCAMIVCWYGLPRQIKRRE